MRVFRRERQDDVFPEVSNHDLPATDVPLREETIPIHGIRGRFEMDARQSFHVEPGRLTPRAERDGAAVVVELPPLERHAMLIGEYLR